MIQATPPAQQRGRPKGKTDALDAIRHAEDPEAAAREMLRPIASVVVASAAESILYWKACPSTSAWERANCLSIALAWRDWWDHAADRWRMFGRFAGRAELVAGLESIGIAHDVAMTWTRQEDVLEHEKRRMRDYKRRTRTRAKGEVTA